MRYRATTAGLAVFVALALSSAGHTGPGREAVRGGVLPATASALVNMLVSDDGSLRAPVSLYTDCTGNARMSYDSAYLDLCWSVPYFGAHDVDWLFDPLLRMPLGSTLTYYDAKGAPHRYRLVASHQVPVAEGRAYLPSPVPGTSAQFGTCLDARATAMRIFDAVTA